MSRFELDPKSQTLLKSIHPEIRARFRGTWNSMAERYEAKLKITETLRSFERQDALYAQGRTSEGRIVTNAKGGQSIHNYGLAIDCCFVGSDPYLAKDPFGEHLWSEFGRLSDGFGFVWGGSFKRLADKPHIEMSFGLSLSDLKSLYDHDGLSAVWSKIDQILGQPIGTGWKGEI